MLQISIPEASWNDHVDLVLMEIKLNCKQGACGVDLNRNKIQISYGISKIIDMTFFKCIILIILWYLGL